MSQISADFKKSFKSFQLRAKVYLFFYFSSFFIETVGAMAATAFAAMTAFEVVFFGEAFVAFGGVIEIFAFGQFIFITLFLHSYKPRYNSLIFNFPKLKNLSGYFFPGLNKITEEI